MWILGLKQSPILVKVDILLGHYMAGENYSHAIKHISCLNQKGNPGRLFI